MSIVIEQVTKRYESAQVVDTVSLQVADGELFVLLGPSGSGKSTLLRIIAGLTPLSAGRITLHGRNVTALPPQERDVGFVFQNYALFPHMTVADNIEFGLRVRHVPAATRKERRDELLKIVGLDGLGHRLPRQLSGGQQQRVALARALAPNPAVLLLDEPFGALDAKIRRDLRQSLRQIQRELGVTTIFVTHDQEEAFELGDRLGVMHAGQLLEVGRPDALYLQPQTAFAATFLGSVNQLRGERTATGVQMGEIHFSYSFEENEKISVGQSVNVLFRPEDIILASTPSEAGPHILGQAVVEQNMFIGTSERLHLRLADMQGTYVPVQPTDGCFSLEALRTLAQARQTPLHSGDITWVGIQRIHILQAANDVNPTIPPVAHISEPSIVQR
jgi:sulfate/thiosulfate transport system ATP-binding protein